MCGNRPVLLAIGIWFIASLVLLNTVGNAQTADIAPYQFGSMKSPSGIEVRLFKTVHQGCELFVAIGDGVYVAGGNSASVAMTTGRGCK